MIESQLLACHGADLSLLGNQERHPHQGEGREEDKEGEKDADIYNIQQEGSSIFPEEV